MFVNTLVSLSNYLLYWQIPFIFIIIILRCTYKHSVKLRSDITRASKDIFPLFSNLRNCLSIETIRSKITQRTEKALSSALSIRNFLLE